MRSSSPFLAIKAYIVKRKRYRELLEFLAASYASASRYRNSGACAVRTLGWRASVTFALGSLVCGSLAAAWAVDSNSPMGNAHVLYVIWLLVCCYWPSARREGCVEERGQARLLILSWSFLFETSKCMQSVDLASAESCLLLLEYKATLHVFVLASSCFLLGMRAMCACVLLVTVAGTSV